MGFALLALLVCWGIHLKSRNLKSELDTLKVHAQQLEELNLVAAGLAHETKNPLGIISGVAQTIIEKNKGVSKTVSMAQKIIDESEVMSERLGEFLNYARSKEPVMAKNSLKECVSDIQNLLISDFEDGNIEFINELSDTFILADKEMLYQVLTNIFLNSIAAMSGGGRILVMDKIKKNRLTLIINDSGSGIAPELLNDIFKPYVSGRKDGHGIGLSVVKKIIHACKWTININSQSGKGTQVCISEIQIVK